MGGGNSDAIMEMSDVQDTSRSIHIVTTAALPWMTGTAVNPLLRALHFQKLRFEASSSSKVTLVIPWVEEKEDRSFLYGAMNTFADGRKGRKEQELYIRNWAKEKAGMTKESQEIVIQFYPARYQKKLGSILTLVDICSLIKEESADIAILEEPEHLSWLSMPSKDSLRETDEFLPSSDFGWTQKFKFVLGIIHTNYPAYVRDYGVRGSRTLASKTIHALNILVCRAYCHKIIKLSATLPVLAKYKECVCNVHGVRDHFLSRTSKANSVGGCDSTQASVYFIGKILWAKGFNFLLHCEEKYKEKNGEYFPIDVFGGGPDFEPIKRAFFGVSFTEKEEKGADVPIEDGSNDEDSVSDESGDSLGNLEEDEDSFFTRLSKAMKPYLERHEVKDDLDFDEPEEEALGTDQKSSTLRTIKDSMKMLKSIPKTNFRFDLQKIPKTRFEWRREAIPARFLGPKDHSLLKASHYKIFLNPSVTEVLCTTSAEALAMGLFVILPRHPSNEFFYQFPNCLAYSDMDEFVTHMTYALSNKPKPLSPELARQFTWEAAMERLFQSSLITKQEYDKLEKSGRIKRDIRKAWIHKESGKIVKGDALRSLVGSPPAEKLSQYEVDCGDDDDGNANVLTFDNKNPRFLVFLSFILAITSYFLQR